MAPWQPSSEKKPLRTRCNRERSPAPFARRAEGLEAELLRSVATERPTFEHRARVRQAMGLAIGGSVAPRPGVTSLGSAQIAIAGLVAAGAIAALLARGTLHHETVAAPAEPPVPIATEPSAPVADPQDLPSAGAPPSPIPRAMAITPSRTRDSRAATTEAASPSDIHEQIRLLDEARAAVGRGDPGAAIRTVDLYRAKYPAGVFNEEATVTRIEALDQSGNHARAASLARAFLAKHPATAHARRLERIAGN